MTYRSVLLTLDCKDCWRRLIGRAHRPLILKSATEKTAISQDTAYVAAVDRHSNNTRNVLLRSN